jgi:hypothetical protein
MKRRPVTSVEPSTPIDILRQSVGSTDPCPKFLKFGTLTWFERIGIVPATNTHLRGAAQMRRLFQMIGGETPRPSRVRLASSFAQFRRHKQRWPGLQDKLIDLGNSLKTETQLARENRWDRVRSVYRAVTGRCSGASWRIVVHLRRLPGCPRNTGGRRNNVALLTNTFNSALSAEWFWRATSEISWRS